MWKCKECGGVVYGVYSGIVDIDKKGVAVESTDREEELHSYKCESECFLIDFGKIQKLKELADWVEEVEDVER